MFEKKRQEEKVRKEEEERQKRIEDDRKKSRTNFTNAKQGRQDNFNHPPPFQPQGISSPASTFLEEVRREVLRVLREVLPVASPPPAQAQAYGLAWPRLQR